MDESHRKIQVIHHDGHSIIGLLTIQDEDPDDPDLVRVSLSVEGEEIGASADDCFSALCKIRTVLEARLLRLRCYGAGRNVHPSAMSQGMGIGNFAYKITMGRPARSLDIVDIFDTGPEVDAVTVEDQRLFFERWISSLGQMGP